MICVFQWGVPPFVIYFKCVLFSLDSHKAYTYRLLILALKGLVDDGSKASFGRCKPINGLFFC